MFVMINMKLTWMRKFLIKPEKIIGCLCKGKYQENIRAQAIDIGVKECQN